MDNTLKDLLKALEIQKAAVTEVASEEQAARDRMAEYAERLTKLEEELTTAITARREAVRSGIGINDAINLATMLNTEKNTLAEIITDLKDSISNYGPLRNQARMNMKEAERDFWLAVANTEIAKFIEPFRKAVSAFALANKGAAAPPAESLLGKIKTDFRAQLSDAGLNESAEHLRAQYGI